MARGREKRDRWITFHEEPRRGRCRAEDIIMTLRRILDKYSHPGVEKMDVTRCLEDIDPDFQYRHVNDSHGWLLNYPGGLRPDPQTLKISSNNETFTEHEIQRRGAQGKRKKLMEAFFRKVISEEVLAGYETEEVHIEEYVTDYMERFKNPDDMPLPGEELSKNEKLKMENQGETGPTEFSKQAKLEELKSKYPLYFSSPVTYFSQMTGRNHFRKNSTITKSPDENYDNIEY